jgi:PEP-CTERM motif
MRRCSVFGAATLAFALLLPRCGLGLTIEPLALSGQPAPGTGGAAFGVLWNGVRVGRGGVAFAGYASTLSGERIWSQPAGAAGVVLQPLAAGSRTALYPIDVLDSGAVAYTDGSALWVPDGSGGYREVAKSGDPAPEPDGAVFGTFDSRSVLTASGEVDFSAMLFTDAPSSRSAILRDDGAGGIETLLEQGDPLPGVPGEVIQSSVRLEGWSHAGDLLVDGPLGTLLVASPGGPFRLLVREGDPVPGSATGATLQTFYAPFVSEGGTTVVPARTSEGGYAIWGAERDGEVHLLFGSDLPAAGLPDGATASAAGLVDLAENGNAALIALLSTSAYALLGPDGGGGLRLLTEVGEPVPGSPGDVFLGFEQIAVNSQGDVAAVASVGPLSGPAKRAYVVFTAGGAVHLIAEEGAPFEVAPGDVRQVVAFGEFDIHRGTFDVQPLEWSGDTRQLAFAAYFGDSPVLDLETTSGVFLVSVPEPGTLLLVLAGFVGLCGRGSRPARHRRIRPGGSAGGISGLTP